MISRQCLLFVKHEKKLKLAKQVPILINSWIKYFRLKWCTCNCCIIDACQDMDGRMEGPKAFNWTYGWKINVREC